MKITKLGVTRDTLNDMRAFGLSRHDIDGDGLITLYHGGRELPQKLNADEIFFMTPHKNEAEDYARMRQGQVFTLRVNPEHVNFNQGSYEVEYTLGGSIRNGEIVPAKLPQPEHVAKDNAVTYRGYAIGDKLPRTGYEILDIVIHSANSAQFYLQTESDTMWHDANTVIKYEEKKPETDEQTLSP